MDKEFETEKVLRELAAAKRREMKKSLSLQRGPKNMDLNAGVKAMLHKEKVGKLDSWEPVWNEDRPRCYQCVVGPKGKYLLESERVVDERLRLKDCVDHGPRVVPERLEPQRHTGRKLLSRAVKMLFWIPLGLVCLPCLCVVSTGRKTDTFRALDGKLNTLQQQAL